MLKASGYSGQLHYMNMYDAYFLFKDGIRDDVTFYAGYYHLLINAMVDDLKKQGAQLVLNSNVDSIVFDDVQEHYIVNGKKTHKIVLCLPKPALMKLDILNPLHNILNGIHTTGITRTYHGHTTGHRTDIVRTRVDCGIFRIFITKNARRNISGKTLAYSKKNCEYS